MNFRYLLAGIFFIGTAWMPNAQANPFRGSFVCVPKFIPQPIPADFVVRDGVSCGPDEKWMKVYTQEDGTVFLYPTDAPLPKQGQKDLDAFKKYYGIDP